MKKVLFLMVAFALAAAGSAQKPTTDVSISLPAGFSSTVMAKSLGRARHLAVNSNGDIYVRLERLKNGNGILRLRDKNGDGKIDDTTGFGNYVGTGIALKGGYLYASSNTGVFRYKMNGTEPDVAHPETIVKDLVDRGQHNSKSITLDNAGNLYVNIGAPSNACQGQDRVTGAPGQDPCPLLEIAGGIWQFKADKQNQSYAEGVRYATGIRNVVGLDWNTATNTLFAMQHGRDGLQDYKIFPDSIAVELPAEEMLEVSKAGDNFGWPYCFYNQFEAKKVLNPEYGGDGKKVGRCADVKPPVIGFPGHMAPNGLLFYTGSQFPDRYKNGAFVAFHGSWNRTPLNQKGFFVVFVPFKDGKPSGDWEVFANGFAGKENITSPGQAVYRPCGLAQGPDGSLYVSDDVKGTIWKISYKK
ncbi:PQQ-dependent sugar dehydrogenase [Flavisolibacter nicotianae]|uniref:PQQ-dependent sugar dehydrogenase n=1 Tax=Flavisolibacter nicotianae TaxID=2364882 RepID=UPI000EAE7071|nr:PQQ-dependent sugar dehydrogenase [Flavisolibacter nicotianae]